MAKQQQTIFPNVPVLTLSRDDSTAATKAHFIVRIVYRHLYNQMYQYRVRWNVYGAEDDTYETLEHLPRNYIARYSKRTSSNPTLPHITCLTPTYLFAVVTRPSRDTLKVHTHESKKREKSKRKGTRSTFLFFCTFIYCILFIFTPSLLTSAKLAPSCYLCAYDDASAKRYPPPHSLKDSYFARNIHDMLNRALFLPPFSPTRETIRIGRHINLQRLGRVDPQNEFDGNHDLGSVLSASKSSFTHVALIVFLRPNWTTGTERIILFRCLFRYRLRIL